MEFSNVNKTCRLCLEVCDGSFEVLDEITQSNLNSLLLFLDLTITDEPTICESCSESITHCLNFKSKCMASENRITSLGCSDDNLGIDLREPYNNCIENGNMNDWDKTSFCCFCREVVKCDSNVYLENEDFDMLQKYFPEVDLIATHQPLTCMPCRKSLRRHFDFITSCLQIEERIIEYCCVEGTNNKGQVDLSNVLNFKSKTGVKNVSESYMVTIKDASISNGVNIGTSCEIKAENDLHIKREVDDEVEPKLESNEYDRSHDEFPPEQLFKCALCSYNSRRKYNLQQHMLSHKSISEVLTYNCDICAFKTKYKNCLQKHMLVHKSADEVIMNRCHICDYKTKQKSNLSKHVRTHRSSLDSANVPVYKCTECNYETLNKNCLQGHMVVHKNSSELAMHKCMECVFETKYKRCLQRHMLTHKSGAELKMYKCPECSHETKHQNNLRKHMLIHKSSSEVTMLRCAVCSFETKHSNSLLKHMIIHKTDSEVVIHRCAECAFQSKHQSSLRKHAIIHRPSLHRCSECGFETKHRNNLQRHMRIHKSSDEVPIHLCDMCAYKTKHKSNLDRHLLTHKKAEPAGVRIGVREYTRGGVTTSQLSGEEDCSL